MKLHFLRNGIVVLILLASSMGFSQGVNVSTISANTTEDGATATFQVTLTTQPTAAVTISLTSDDLSEGTVPASITIPALDWSVGRTVTVTGVDDSDMDGAIAYNIITTDVSSADPAYDALDGSSVADVAVINDDNDLTNILLAFTGFNADGNSDFSIGVLSDIPPGTTIFFTDNNWDGSSLSTSEGEISWTTGAETIPAGTVVHFNDLSAATSIQAALGTIDIGSFSKTGTFNLAASGETIFAYLGTSGNPSVFLAAISTEGADLSGTTLPYGLKAIDISSIDAGADIAAYDGNRFGVSQFSEFSELINDPGNWSTQDATGDQSDDGTFPDVPFSGTIFSLLEPLDCPSRFYQFVNGELFALNPYQGVYSNNLLSGNLVTGNQNSAGYNQMDNYMYALEKSNFHLIRYDQSGNAYDLGQMVNSSQGDIVNDTLYFEDGNDYSYIPNVSYLPENSSADLTAISIDLTGTWSPGASTKVRDVAYIEDGPADRGLWGAKNNQVYFWNLVDHTTTVKTVSGLPSGTYGAAYTDADGRLYVSNNNGGVYLIQDYETASPTAFYLNISEATNSNDGLSCRLAKSSFDQDNDSILDPLDADGDGDGIPNIDESGGNDPYADTDSDGIFVYLDDDDGNASIKNDDGQVNAAFDFDGDGTPNFLDLDSDNDGVYDMYENGLASLDTNNDGRYNPDDAGFNATDSDGDDYIDVIEGLGITGAAGIPNEDGDAQDNFLDIDSDGDGIVDIIEAQPTVGFIAPSGTDDDIDGIDDAYDPTEGGTLIDPVNTDGLGDNPDYLDLDSDEDGILDLTEAYDTNGDGTPDTNPASSDVPDSDGLDDNFDVDDSNVDPQNGGQLATDFPDDDEPGLDRDWRDSSGAPNINLDIDNDNGTPSDSSDDGVDDGSFQTEFIEDGSGAVLHDSDAEIADLDDDFYLNLIVTFSTGTLLDGSNEFLTIGGEVFELDLNKNVTNITAGTSTLTIDYVAATGVFTITETGDDGNIPEADINMLFTGITYSNTKPEPTEGTRTFSFTTQNSSTQTSNTVVASVSVVTTNDEPGTDLGNDGDGDDALVTFIEEGSPLDLMNTPTITDPDDTSFPFVSITVSGVLDGDQEVLFIDGESFPLGTDKNISGTITGFDIDYVQSSGIITITNNGGGEMNETDIESLLDGITYDHTNDDNPQDGDRILSIVVNDGEVNSQANTVTINVDPVNDPPDTDLGDVGPNTDDAAVTYIEEDAAVDLMISPMLTDVDDTTFPSMTLTISGVLDGDQEVLNIGGSDFPLGTDVTVAISVSVNSENIDIVYNSSTGIFTLTETVGGDGELEKATLEAVLDGISYDHTNNNNPKDGDRILSVVVNDGEANSPSNTATINVDPVNDPPVADDDVLTVDEGSTLAVDVADGDTDVDGTIDLGSIAIVSGPSNGILTDNGDGTIDYAHDGTETTTDSFTYTIDDNSGATSNVATVTITITPVNDPPVADDDALTVNEGSTLAVDVADGDTDVDGTIDLGSIAIVSGPSNGILTDNGDGTIDYAHDGTETTTDSFTYTIDDNSGATSNVATVTITITPVNDPPVADDDALTVNEGATGTVDVADGDTDVDGTIDFSSITIVSGPSNGTLTDNGDGTIDYAHDGSETTTDSFTYTIADNSGATSNTATVTITITPVNDAPVADDDALTVNEGATGTVDVADGDTDVDGTIDLSSITIVSGPSNGTLTDNGDGTIDYAHDGSETTTDSFTYTIDDNSGATSNVATVTITITPVNDPPVANEVVHDILFTDTINEDLKNNVSDPEGGTLTFTLVGSTPDPSSEGTLVLNSDGTYTFTPVDGFIGSVVFTYEVCDDGTPSLCAQADVTINVTGNRPPEASPATYTVNSIEGISESLVSLVTDPDNDNLTFTLVTGPTTGELSLNSNGDFTYLPEIGFVGQTTFTYQVCDDGNPTLCDQAIVTLDIPTIDSDGDGISDDEEIDDPDDPNDCDLDGTPDYLDADECVDLKSTIVMTPNGDGYNDYFRIENIDHFPDNRVVIFNRWGNEVWRIEGYVNDDPNRSFSGNANSGIIKNSAGLPDGTYYYVIDLQDGSPVKKGFVVIKR